MAKISIIELAITGLEEEKSPCARIAQHPASERCARRSNGENILLLQLLLPPEQ